MYCTGYLVYLNCSRILLFFFAAFSRFFVLSCPFVRVFSGLYACGYLCCTFCVFRAFMFVFGVVVLYRVLHHLSRCCGPMSLHVWR